MLIVATLMLASTRSTFPVRAPIQVEPPCLVILGGPQIAKVSKSSEFFDAAFLNLASKIRAKPSEQLRKQLEANFDYLCFNGKGVNICYPRNFLGIEKLKTESDLLRAIVVGKVPFGSTVPLSSWPSDAEGPLRKRLQNEFSTPYMRQVASSGSVVAKLQCGLMISLSTGNDAFSQFVQYPIGSNSGQPEELPLVSPGSDADLKKWLEEAEFSADLEFRCLTPNTPALASTFSKGIESFFAEFNKQLQSTIDDLAVIEKRFFDRFCREVLDTEPSAFPKSGAKFSELPDSLKNACLQSLNGNPQKLGLNTREEVSSVVRRSSISIRYAVPVLTIRMRKADGKQIGYGLTIGPSFLP